MCPVTARNVRSAGGPLNHAPRLSQRDEPGADERSGVLPWAVVPGLSVGAYAPVGAPALRFDTATNRPLILTECRQVVGDTPLLPLRRQK